jgi:hypothetical protein
MTQTPTPELLALARLPDALGTPLEIALSQNDARSQAYLEALHAVHGDAMWASRPYPARLLVRVCENGDVAMAQWMRAHGAAFDNEDGTAFDSLGTLLLRSNERGHTAMMAWLVEQFPEAARGHMLSLGAERPDTFEWRLEHQLVHPMTGGIDGVLGQLADTGDYGRMGRLLDRLGQTGWTAQGLESLRWQVLEGVCLRQSLINIVDYFQSGPVPDLRHPPMAQDDLHPNLESLSFDDLAGLAGQAIHAHPVQRDLLSVLMEKCGTLEALAVFGAHPHLVGEYRRRIVDGVPVFLQEIFRHAHVRDAKNLRPLFEVVFDTRKLIDINTSTRETPWAGGMVATVCEERPDGAAGIAGWVCERHPALLFEHTPMGWLGDFLSQFLSRPDATEDDQKTRSLVETAMIDMTAPVTSRPGLPGRRL